MRQHCPPAAQSADRAHAPLLDRIANDRLAEDQISHGGDPVTEPVYRRAFNAGSRHVEHLVRLFLTEQRLMAACDEQRVLAGLRELRDAHPIDLRVKYALILGTDNGPSGTSAPPVASQDTGTFHPPQIDATPHGVSAGATPPAREVGGGFEVGS